MTPITWLFAKISGNRRHKLSLRGFLPSDRGIIDACRVQLAAPGGRDPCRAAVPAPTGTPGAHGETAGVSWSWAALTSINNAAWAGYFALSGFWTALVPAISATVLAGALAVLGARRGAGCPRRPAALTLAWAALLITAASLFGRAGLG